MIVKIFSYRQMGLFLEFESFLESLKVLEFVLCVSVVDLYLASEQIAALRKVFFFSLT